MRNRYIPKGQHFSLNCGVTVEYLSPCTASINCVLLRVNCKSEAGQELMELLMNTAKVKATDPESIKDGNNICYVIGFRGIDPLPNAKRLVFRVSNGFINIGVGLIHADVPDAVTGVHDMLDYNDIFGINTEAKVEFHSYETADIRNFEMRLLMNRDSQVGKKLEAILLAMAKNQSANPDAVRLENKVCYSICTDGYTDAERLVVKVWDGRISIGIGVKRCR